MLQKCNIQLLEILKEDKKVENRGKFKQTEKMLYDYKYIDSKVNILQFKLEKLQNDITVSGLDYSKDKISSTNSFNSVVENETINRDSGEIKIIDQEIKQLQYQKKLIDMSLPLLEEEEQRLVKLRYFSKDKRTWINIATEMNMTSDNCIKIRKRIIDKLQSYLI